MIINARTILCLDLGTKTGWQICSKGHAPKDDNEADALAILYLMKEGGAHV
ncbi:hypothetical protein [Bartonella vinsonii]|uniref:hypothetical protein n=1 Tax=Bartonella vinsonii TaxID=33047 RepID=UPI00039EA223|nr:hypothetical protein [Bartonella vinsonii]